MPSKTPNQDPIVVEDFTQIPEVISCINELEKQFGPGGKTLLVSDVLDTEGHQYVNLVQKGGGVLGVALVGYTYVLEKMGIRFIRLAGTSAGAINTALMSVTGAVKTNGRVNGNKTIAKSEMILEAICNLNFFDLVDGHPAARLLIRNFITNDKFSKLVSRWVTAILLILIGLPVADFICLGLQYSIPWVANLTKLFYVLTGFYALLLSVAIGYVVYLLTRLKTAGFGINPGDFFYDWIKARLQENNVFTVQDLEEAASTTVNGLRLREGVENPENLNGLEGDVTFITSEIVSQNKIEFPKMSALFRNDVNDLQPAGFVRASMSIPLFFESYFIDEIPCSDPNIVLAWKNMLGTNVIPSTARFVDGGILSNFPINLFYNPKVLVPRLPSFGIDLDDEKAPGNQSDDEAESNDEALTPEKWSLGGYIYRIFNTVRFYYDKDFLIKNEFFAKGIGTIPLKGFNWLNFFLDKISKQQMFILGAQAATEFLRGFKWNEYKEARKTMQTTLIKKV